MKCKLCVKWEKNTDSCKNYLDAFAKGSQNYKRLLSDYVKTLQHEKTKELEEKEKCETSGLPYRKNVYQVKQSLYKDANLHLLNLCKTRILYLFGYLTLVLFFIVSMAITFFTNLYFVLLRLIFKMNP